MDTTDGDFKICFYRCSACGGREFKRVWPRSQRKVRGFCKEHKTLIEPYETKYITKKEGRGRERKLPSLW